MVVDDDSSIREFIKMALENEGLKILLAPEGEAALRMLETETPDLILLDIMMPVMDGFTMCRKVKDNPKTSKIPIVFVSAYAEEDGIEKAQSSGAEGFMEKPLSYKELLNHVFESLKRQLSLSCPF